MPSLSRDPNRQRESPRLATLSERPWMQATLPVEPERTVSNPDCSLTRLSVSMKACGDRPEEVDVFEDLDPWRAHA